MSAEAKPFPAANQPVAAILLHLGSDWGRATGPCAPRMQCIRRPATTQQNPEKRPPDWAASGFSKIFHPRNIDPPEKFVRFLQPCRRVRARVVHQAKLQCAAELRSFVVYRNPVGSPQV